jgi:hypothetical protein
MRWTATHPDFAALVSRGRIAGAEHSVHRLMDIAETTTSKNARGNRIRMQAHQWLASRFHPALYGDKAQAQVSVNVDLDALVSGAMALADKQRPKLVDAEVTELKPLDVVKEPAK